MSERAWTDRDGVEWKVRVTRSMVTQPEGGAPAMESPTTVSFRQEFGHPAYVVNVSGLRSGDLLEIGDEDLQAYLDAAREGADV